MFAVTPKRRHYWSLSLFGLILCCIQCPAIISCRTRVTSAVKMFFTQRNVCVWLIANILQKEGTRHCVRADVMGFLLPRISWSLMKSPANVQAHKVEAISPLDAISSESLDWSGAPLTDSELLTTAASHQHRWPSCSVTVEFAGVTVPLDLHFCSKTVWIQTRSRWNLWHFWSEVLFTSQMLVCLSYCRLNTMWFFAE